MARALLRLGYLFGDLRPASFRTWSARSSSQTWVDAVRPRCRSVLRALPASPGVSPPLCARRWGITESGSGTVHDCTRCVAQARCRRTCRRDSAVPTVVLAVPIVQGRIEERGVERLREEAEGRLREVRDCEW